MRTSIRMSAVVAALLAAGPGWAVPSASADEVTCGGQVATIVAVRDAQHLTGTDGPDVISTGDFNGGEIEALGGDDTICTGGTAQVYAGDGDDTVVIGRSGPQDGFATVAPGAGDDVVTTPGPIDVTYRDFHARPAAAPPVVIDVAAGTVDGQGHDVIDGPVRGFTGSGNGDTFLGSDGDDTFRSRLGHGEAQVESGGGDDLVVIRSGTVDAGDGDDHVYLTRGGTATGGAGDDLLVLRVGGTALGGPGDDHLMGEQLRTWSGAEIETGTFLLRGGPGDDDLEPPRQFSSRHPTCGDQDVCRVEADGGGGTDVLDLRFLRGGTAVVDLARRTFEHPRVAGQVAHVEDVIGSAGADRLYGDARSNRLVGGIVGAHPDLLVGRGGDDVLVSITAGSQLVGGPGRDRCRGPYERPC